MPTKIKVGSWYRLNFPLKVLSWSLSQMFGCFCFAFDLLKWLFNMSGTLTEEFGLSGVWHDILFIWWTSVDRSNRWIGKTVEIVKHTPGEY